MTETTYNKYVYNPNQVAHLYGPHIHLVTDPLSLSRLEILGRPETLQPAVNSLIQKLYQQLLTYISAELPCKNVQSTTRMTAVSGECWQGRVVDEKAQVVIAGIARAGTMPAELLFAELCQIIDPRQVRIDHLYMARAVGEDGVVTGTNLAGHKIGGSIAGATLLIPDPMGATGGTIIKTLELYRELNLGQPRKVVAMHLIITPEYINKIKELAPDLEVYALRLDRGLSSARALAATAGQYAAEERGLSVEDYIIPGLGGVGEIMSNSYV